MAEIPNDRLKDVREKVIKLRDTNKEIADTEMRLEELTATRHQIERVELPDIFNEYGVKSLGLEKAGNLPGYDAKLQPFYRANIAANWDDKRREEAFAALVKHGGESLIKTVVSIELGRGDHAMVKKIIKALKPLGVDVKVAEAVHFQTLTAWLKELVEGNKELIAAKKPPKPIPPLDVIGAEIGEVVKLKETKEP